jgi:hypothetical protein
MHTYTHTRLPTTSSEQEMGSNNLDANKIRLVHDFAQTTCMQELLYSMVKCTID